MTGQPDPRAVAERVWRGAEAADFRGPDPYDGLTSRLLAPLLPRSRWLRLAVIQGVKRSPFDLRPLLMTRPALNPKGVALFLHGAALCPAIAGGPEACATLADRLLGLASLPDGTPYFGTRDHRPGLAGRIASGELPCTEPLGWGYDFPWQAKAFLQPPYYPTVVATSFAVDALAAASSPACAPVLAAAARFVTGRLHRHEEAAGVCFSYSPRDRSRVLNASLFAAKLLARAAALGDAEAGRLARRAGDYAAARQQNDGSWLYGEADHWRWIDNLHTGFVLETLDHVAGSLAVSDWDGALARGLAYYRQELFRPDGTALYYPGRDYPLDPHSFAQGALTFLALRRLAPDGPAFATSILTRGIEELWDGRRGGFTTRTGRWRRDRTIYLRWSQAWMFKALCARLSCEEGSA